MWPFLPLQSFSGLRLTTEMQLAFEVNRTNFRNSFGLISLVCAPAQWEAIPRIHSVNFQWDVTRQAIKQRLSYVRGQACLHRYRPRLRPLRNKSAHAPTACPSRRVPIPSGRYQKMWDSSSGGRHSAAESLADGEATPLDCLESSSDIAELMGTISAIAGRHGTVD